MQILRPFAGSIQQYAEEYIDPDRYRPTHCPQCQAQHSLTAHGFRRSLGSKYERLTRAFGVEGMLLLFMR